MLHLSAACCNHAVQFNIIQSGGEEIKSQTIKLKAAPPNKSMYLETAECSRARLLLQTSSNGAHAGRAKGIGTLRVN